MESDCEVSPPLSRECGAGHHASHSLPTSAGGRVCLSCAAALLSSSSAPSHHVSHVLASLSLVLADPAILAPLRAAHPRLLAAPLAEALASAAARRDAALAAQASDLASAVGPPAASELVARLSRVPVVKHLHTVCRRQVYEGSSKAQLSEQKADTVARSVDDVRALLFGMVLNQRAASSTVQMEQQKLLREIDLFFQESSRRE